MRPSDILIRKLHNLVSDTNLWMTPEYKDNKKEDTNMQVINISIIDETTKGTIEASIFGCDNAYKRQDNKEVETHLDILLKMSDEIFYFIKYVYEAEHKIALKGDKIGDTYKDMIVYSFGPADKSTLRVELMSITFKN